MNYSLLCYLAGTLSIILLAEPVYCNASSSTNDSIVVTAHITTDPEAFKKSALNAAKIEHDPIAEKYRNEKFYAYFGPSYATVMQNCFKAVPDPSTNPFSFILTLEASGMVKEIAADKPTNIARCLMRQISVDNFPAPPYSPFIERIDMKITP